MAYIYHLILAVCIALILAMIVHLWAINASPDVVGGGIFLLVAWVGLPILFCFFAALVYCHKTRYDRRLIVLTALLIVAAAAGTAVAGLVTLILWIVLALLYIGLTAFFWFTQVKQQPK